MNTNNMEKRPRIAVYPGSFDPVTLGHLDIIHRAARQFDTLVVAVLNNLSKKPLFSVEERVAQLKEVTADLPNIEIDSFRDLLANYIRDRQADVIVRGIRSVTDFEYELQMASINRELNPEAETIFMMTNPRYSYLSSSMVKEIAQFNGHVSEFVPPLIERDLKMKFNTAAGN